MPELPEVETIKKQLVRKIAGKKIKTVKIFLPKIIKTLLRKNFVSDGSAVEIKTPLNEFKRAIFGSVIKNVGRRAKLLIIGLTNEYSLLIHLKMTGQLIYEELRINSTSPIITSRLSKNKELRKYTHVIFNFTDGSRLLFNDLRQFGYIKLLKNNKAKELLNKEYGPEPLESNFTIESFKYILAKKPRAKIKQFLIDQKNIAGIGNLYADEILFAARVLPTRKNSSLNAVEIKKIFNSVKKILREAIKYRGSSVENYLDARGQVGEYHLRLNVYGRKEQPCKKCKNPISKIKMNGRGTHFCSKCQK